MIASFSGPHAFLSNFHPCLIVVGNTVYASSEHLYQANKALSANEHRWVAEAPTPAGAKKRGRRVQLVPDWERIKLAVMYTAVRAKFDQNPDLAKDLLDTGVEEIVEANAWRDCYWGVDERTGQGSNWLGRILMLVRSEIAMVEEIPE